MSDILTLVGELGLLHDEPFRLFVSLWTARQDVDASSTIVKSKETEFSKIFIKLLLNIHVETAKQEFLEVIADLCTRIPTFASAFADESDSKIFAEQPLMTCSAKHLLCVAYVLCFRKSNDMKTAVAQYLKYTVRVFELAAQEARSSEEKVSEVLHSLTVFLRKKEYRDELSKLDIFTQILSFINLYCSDMSSSIQLLYDCLFCIWVSVYNPQSLESLHRKKLIPIVHDVLKRCTKEKCIRMGIIIFKTLLTLQARFADPENILFRTHPALVSMNNGRGPRLFADMVSVGALKTLSQLSKRTWGDEDMSGMIEDLESALQCNVEELTTFSEYVGEVQSGVLEWSPTHTSTKFWKENLKNIENNEFQILRELSNLLLTSKHDPTLAIACHDFGEVVRHHPHGRKILALPSLNGVKERIMELMNSSNQDVSRHSLLALQKIMVQRWEFLDRTN